ncbi:MAG TPA: universal stress protein [Chloroflexota bacterium]|nr:universal stress protein [Chloroflexota bacterium]HUM67945.1 universal stress protein [Chloroflexota bacterium]
MIETAWIRHILVGLDTSRMNAAVLHTAVRLSAFLKADITGLFVEDINLIRLAQLPFSSEVRYLTAGTRPLHQEQMQQVLHSHATWLRYEFGQTASERAIKWDFRVARGFVSQELLAAAHEADLLVIGRLSSHRGVHQRVGSTALTAVQQAASSVLVVSPEADFSHPIALLYDGSAAAAYALPIALSLAQLSKQLTIYIQAQDEEEAARIQQNLRTAVNDNDILCSYRRWLPGQNLAQLWAEQTPGMVVLGNGREGADASFADQLLHTAPCPVLFIRPPVGGGHLHPD